MEVLLMAVMGAANILCFMIGAKVGQTVTKGEKVEMPSVNPIKAMKEHQAKKEADWETEKLKTIMSNIESYDGTSYGQKEVPKG
jgi:hypothetical protein